MTAYYNEIDPHAAATLRELIKAGVIANGIVDTRSIADVTPNDVRGFTQCHWFAGIGGWSLALRLAGWPDSRRAWTGSCPCQPFSQAGKGAGTSDIRHLWPDWMHLIRQSRPAIVFGEQVASAIRHGWLDTVFDDLENSGYACGAANLPAASVGAPHLRERVWFVGELADSSRDGRGQREPIAGNAGRWTGSRAEALRCGDAGELADADEQRDERQRLGGSGGRRESANGSELGNANNERLAGRQSVGGNYGAQFQAAERAGRDANEWDAVEWLECIDNKQRPTKPGILPLVDGLPRGVVPSSRAGLAINANATAEGRAMRIRGYGNAIAPQVAAEFIRAVML